MNCPKCGIQILSDQQFCRSCGADLTAGVRRGFRPQSFGLVALVMTSGGLLVSLAGAMVELRWLIFAGVFIMIGGMFLIAALSMLRQSRPRKGKPNPVQHQIDFEQADTTNKLLPIGNNDFIPSVTEGTTELLKTPAHKRSISLD